jgi:hypothetical protein
LAVLRVPRTTALGIFAVVTNATYHGATDT